MTVKTRCESAWRKGWKEARRSLATGPVKAAGLETPPESGKRTHAYGLLMTVRIIPATLRDLSYIAANLRPEDKAEIDCQFDQWSPALLALMALQGFAYVAEFDGNPEAGFGAAEQHGGLWIAWSWGTRRMKRCVPGITEFFHAVLGRQVAARRLACRGEGVGRQRTGAALARPPRRHATLPAAGLRQERRGFFALRLDKNLSLRESWNHVPLPKAAGAEAAATDTDHRRQGRAGARSSPQG